MYNGEILIVILLILVPAGLLAMLVSAFVMALGARRALREMQGRVTQLQRDVGGLKYQLREQAAGSPAVAAPKAATPVVPPPPPPPSPVVVPSVPPVAPAPQRSTACATPSVSVVPPVVPPRQVPAAPRPPLPPPRRPAAPTQPKRTIEERLGTQLPIWIGAIALGIGGIWLAKYIIEHSHFGPTVRILGGASLGIVMLAVGAWGHQRNRHIAAAVVAAGIADLYGWVFAAAGMYHLIPITLGFALMIGITALAVGLSLRQGPIVAIVGMVGAFLTPALLHTGNHNPAVFAYLMLLQVGLLVVTRRKGWWPLAALTLAGSLIWAGGWVIGMMLGAFPMIHGKWVALFMLGSAASMVFGADSDKREAWPVPGVGRVLGWISAVASLVILAMVVQVTDFTGQQWALMGILAAGCLALGRLRKPYEALAWLAEAMVLALVTMWAMRVDHSGSDDWSAMRWTTFAFGVLFAFGAYVCAWGGSKPARWFGMSAGSAVAWFVLAYYAPFPLPEHWRWWMVALLVAGALMVMCVPVQLRRAKITGGDESLAWLLIGVSVMLAIAASLGLHKQNISIAWALEVPAIALIGCRLRVPRLKWMAMSVAAGVLVRLVFNPHVLDYEIGQHIIWNWLSYGYGVPVIAFALAAWIYTRYKEDDPPLRTLLEGGAMLLGFMLVSLQIRHGFHPESFRDEHLSWIESATYINGWLVFALAMLASAWRWTRQSMVVGGAIVGVVGLMAMLIVLLGYLNPLFAEINVGETRVFNWLLYAYGLPILWCAAGAWLLRKHIPQAVGTVVGCVLALGFVLVSLEIRHGFHTQIMRTGGMSWIESATYVNGWMILALILLAGAWRWSRQSLIRGGAIVGVIGLAALLIGLLGWQNPLFVNVQVGQTRIFNWLLFGYGLPIVWCAGGAWLVRKTIPQAANQLFAIALAMGFILLSMEIRHGFHPQAMKLHHASLIELATYCIAWLMLGGGLFAIGRRWTKPLLENAGLVIGVLGIVLAIAGLIGAKNPMWVHESVGQMRVFNWLLFAYGLPMVLAGVFGWLVRSRQQAVSVLAGVLSLVLLWLMISLQVRQWFAGEFLNARGFTHAEQYAYSAAWVLLGLGLLGAGIVVRGKLVRFASLAVMLLVVCKVFLFDTRHLGDLLRVFSFLGLGVSLLLLAFLYQRFVFRRTSPAPRVGD